MCRRPAQLWLWEGPSPLCPSVSLSGVWRRCVIGWCGLLVPCVWRSRDSPSSSSSPCRPLRSTPHPCCPCPGPPVATLRHCLVLAKPACPVPPAWESSGAGPTALFSALALLRASVPGSVAWGQRGVCTQNLARVPCVEVSLCWRLLPALRAWPGPSCSAQTHRRAPAPHFCLALALP